MLGQGFGGERLGLSLAVFIPTAPPAFDVLSLVDPWFFHDPNYIGTFYGEGHWWEYFADQIDSKQRHEMAWGAYFYCKLF